MKERILDEIARVQNAGKKITGLRLLSVEAANAITRSPEYVRREFIGIPVYFPGRDNQIPAQDFIVDVED